MSYMSINNIDESVWSQKTSQESVLIKDHLYYQNNVEAAVYLINFFKASNSEYLKAFYTLNLDNNLVNKYANPEEEKSKMRDKITEILASENQKLEQSTCHKFKDAMCFRGFYTKPRCGLENSDCDKSNQYDYMRYAQPKKLVDARFMVDPSEHECQRLCRIEQLGLHRDDGSEARKNSARNFDLGRYYKESGEAWDVNSADTYSCVANDKDNTCASSDDIVKDIFATNEDSLIAENVSDNRKSSDKKNFFPDMNYGCCSYFPNKRMPGARKDGTCEFIMGGEAIERSDIRAHFGVDMTEMAMFENTRLTDGVYREILENREVIEANPEELERRSGSVSALCMDKRMDDYFANMEKGYFGGGGN